MSQRRDTVAPVVMADRVTLELREEGSGAVAIARHPIILGLPLTQSLVDDQQRITPKIERVVLWITTLLTQLGSQRVEGADECLIFGFVVCHPTRKLQLFQAALARGDERQLIGAIP